MIKFLKIVIFLYASLLLQVTILPAYIADPFKPNLLIIIIAYLGLKEKGWQGAVLAFLLGLTADCFSGQYLGLSAFSFLSIHLFLSRAAGRLYTDSVHLMVIVVFLATIANGLIDLLLLMLFSLAQGVYTSVLLGLLPQALVSTLLASLLFRIPSSIAKEESI